MKKLLINIDFDGVLIPDHLEAMLFECLIGVDFIRLSSLPKDMFEWYLKLVNTSKSPPLNLKLLKFFANNMDKYTLKLWTNRFYDLRKKTIKDLGSFKSIFDSFEFHGGNKIDSKVEGIVIDNNPKYLKCGEFGGILYEWEGGD